MSGRPLALVSGTEPYPGYRLLKPLGSGGWSEVWKARQPDGSECALKFMPCDPGLAPAMVADQLGVSVRHLHMLFEAAAKSFSQTVTDERLKQSRRLMREAPDRLIADIATSCGFESLATYYRVFNAAYGMAPGDFRARGPEGR